MSKLRGAVIEFINIQKQLARNLSSAYQEAREFFTAREHQAYFKPYEDIFEVIGLESELEKNYFPHAGLLDAEKVPENITLLEATEIMINIFKKKSFVIIYNNSLLAFAQLIEVSEILKNKAEDKKTILGSKLGSVNSLTRYEIFFNNLVIAKNEIADNLSEFDALMGFIKPFAENTLKFSQEFQIFLANLENPDPTIITTLQSLREQLKTSLETVIPDLAAHIQAKTQTPEADDSSTFAWKRAVRRNDDVGLRQLFKYGLKPEKVFRYIFPTDSDGTIKPGEASAAIKDCVIAASHESLANTEITSSSEGGYSYRRRKGSIETPNEATTSSNGVFSSPIHRSLPPAPTKAPPAPVKVGVNTALKKYPTNSLKDYAKGEPISGKNGLKKIFEEKKLPAPAPGF